MAPRRRIGWHTISLDTLRGLTILLAILVLVGAGFFGYRHWEGWALDRQAGGLIEEARGLYGRLHSRGDLQEFREEAGTGRRLLQEAEQLYADGDLRQAAERGRKSRDVLAAILHVLERKGERGEASFISVHGNVEYRRGDRDEWQEVRTRVQLASGDRVRTGSNGSAEIMFEDGTLYTVNPNSSIVITRRRSAGGNEQTVRMEHGWLGLMTAETPTRVEMPDAEAQVASDSEAIVSYEQGSRTGRIASVRGSVEVSNEGGQRRSLGELEQVVQQGSVLSEPEPLPPAPQLMAPTDMREVDASRNDELTLTWLPVEGARSYALQVSRNSLFADNVIADSGRRKTSARLGIRGEGSFFWRVAAEDPRGEKGPWSAHRSFRVAAAGAAPEVDGKPPDLVIEDAVGYGSIFIVEGRTDPGVRVEINGEPVQVDAQGSFTKTIQLAGEGLSFIEVRASDAWGKTTERRIRVYVESP